MGLQKVVKRFFSKRGAGLLLNQSKHGAKFLNMFAGVGKVRLAKEVSCWLFRIGKTIFGCLQKQHTGSCVGWHEHFFIEMPHFEAVWCFRFHKLEHSDERKLILFCAGVTGVNLQAWARDEALFLKSLALSFAPASENMTSYTALNVEAFTSMISKIFTKGRSVRTMLEI